MAEGHADPERIRTRDDLARELTVLRTEAGRTVRDLARHVDAPVATVGDYFSGRHLPGTRQISLFQAILSACGVSDPVLLERWVAAIGRVRLSGDGRVAKGPAPYRGLDPFDEAHAHLFFGRQRVIEELLGRLRHSEERTPAGGAVGLVGPSGSGKTSLLSAGLLPALRNGALGDDGRRTEATAVALDEIEEVQCEPPPAAAEGRRVVIVDQIETALGMPAARRAGLLTTLHDLQRTSLIVVSIRADFYHAAVAEPALLPALNNQVILPPMTVEELREAVVSPIHTVGAGIEEGLVDLILADLAPGSPPGFAHEPGTLPLLSYALLTTWERTAHNQLTIADYRAVGGLRGAVEAAAEGLFADLTTVQQRQARRMFSRLVRLDDHGPPTRRRASRTELVTSGAAEDTETVTAVLERFVAARLVTADADTIQMSHEALLVAWPRLAEWLSSDREWLRMHHQIADAAQAWGASGRDESLLWRGLRLETALALAAAPGRDLDLNVEERELLAASSQQHDHEERTRRRRVRRTQQLLGLVAAFAVAASVFAGLAVSARASADRERDQALSRQLAVEAQQVQPTDPSVAAQLALAGYRLSPTVQASSALLDATAGEIPMRLRGPVGPEFVSASGGGRLLAVAQSAADSVALYRLSSSRAAKIQVLRAGPSSEQDFAVAISHDGRLLAAGGTSRTVALWDIADPKRPIRVATLAGLGGTVYSLEFTPEDRRLAAGASNGTVHQWRLAGSSASTSSASTSSASTSTSTPTAAATLVVPTAATVKAVAYSSSGTWLAAAGDNGALDVWKAGDSVPIVATGTGSADFESVAFDPGGTQLTVGIGNDDTVETWDLVGGDQLQLVHGPFVAATADVTSTVYSTNGSILAEAAGDGTLHLYDTRTWATLATFGDPDPITSLTFASGGRSLVSADSGGVTRIWPIPPPSTDTEPGNVYTLSYTARGRYLIACSAGPEGGVTIWDNANPLRPTRLVDVEMPADFGAAAGAAALTPDGRLLAVANASAEIQLFDLAAIDHPVPIGPLLHGDKPYIEQLGFTPNGKVLVAGDDGGQLHLWNVNDTAHPRALPTVQVTTGEVIGFSFSPNGHILATASSDKKVRIYNISKPAHAKLLATVGGFSSYAYDAVITPNGRTLIAGSADGTVRMWNISDPSRPQLLGPPLSIPAGYVYALDVSPDGRTLAAASTAHAVWLWNIADPSRPQLLSSLTADPDEVFAVQFDPDNQVLAASGSDNVLHFWDYQPDTAARRVCSSAGYPITRAEWAEYVQGASYQPPCP